MGQMIQNVQIRIKQSSSGIFCFLLRLFSGFFLGLTIAIVGQIILGYGSLSYWFVIVSLTMAFLRVSKGWNIGGVLVFDLVCVLFAMLLRMYILIAPGA